MYFKRYSILLIIFAVSILQGCGGGSGSGSNSNSGQSLSNSSPRVNAGDDKSVLSGQSVILSGTATDSDGTIAVYLWQQISGEEVSLENAESASASFTAPITGVELTLTFQLSATDDDNATSSDTVIITVQPELSSPSINAGADQSAISGDSVTLSASANDLDGEIISYLWQQTAGTSVTLTNSDQAVASFTAPDSETSQSLTFSVTVTDDDGLTATDSIDITVEPTAVSYDSEPVVYAIEGAAYHYRPDFQNWNGQSGVSYSINNKPEWATFNSTSGELSGEAALDSIGESRFFDIEIIATKGDEEQRVGPFNITLTQPNGQIEGKILVVVTSFSDTTSSINQADVTASYAQMAEFIGELSHDRQEADFTLAFIGSIDQSLTNIKAWAETSTFLAKAFQNTDPDYDDVCVVADILADAEAIFAAEKDTYQSFYGYEIEALDTRFAETITQGNPCAEKASGEIALKYIDIPEDYDVDSFNAIVFQIYDTDHNSGGFQSVLEASVGVTQGGAAVEDKTFLVSGATDFNQSQLMRYPDFDEEVQADYFTGAQIQLTEFEQQTVHEIIHALGVGTHDCGLDYYTSVDFSSLDTTLQGDNYSNFGYGDWFSVMGRSSYSTDLAPSTKEYLGWVNSNEILTYSESVSDVVIEQAFAESGKVFAKIKVNSGWLYVSYYNGASYSESLTHPNLNGNLEGVQIRYTGERNIEVYKTLTTSTLLDPNEDLTDHDYALKPGESFEIFDVRIDNVTISGTQARFDITYTE